MNHPITPAHLASFTTKVAHYQRILGLTDWRIEVHQAEGDGDDVYAWIKFGVEEESMLARIFISREWRTMPDKHALDDTALHEVLHVLLRPLLADGVAREEHAVIHRLVDVMLWQKQPLNTLETPVVDD